MSTKSRFGSIATAGIAFQAGSAAVDSATVMSALVYQLSGSSILVGAVTAILRFGWLFPQIFVAYFAQARGSSMRYYMIGAFGRALCIAGLACTLLAGAAWPDAIIVSMVMLLWTAYAFISGIVAVPYNDIVARSVPSELRSRLMAARFFGGGVLALGVAALANRFVGTLSFPLSYAAILGMAASLMFISSFVFTAMGEPKAGHPKDSAAKPTFLQYLRDGWVVFLEDRTFRLFVFAQWCGGAVLMATPFYIVQANSAGVAFDTVALLLGAQTTGALLSNVLWGWWGDRLGKCSLLKAIAFGRTLPPLIVTCLIWAGHVSVDVTLPIYLVLFFMLGALANGLTIAVVGFLMEISPDEKRPAYSGYFNAITAPAFLLPLLAGILVSMLGLSAIFIVALIAAVLQTIILAKIQVPVAPDGA